jgi:integrase
MYKGARKVVEKYGEPMVCELKPVAIWNKYRRKGLDGRGEVTSAANHLRTFLRQFADWAVREGYLPERVKKEVDGIPLVKINSRRLTPPSGKVVDEYLKMIESEDHLGGQYLRFLATTGLRLSGGLRLSWDRIDLERKEIEAVMKGGRVETLPLTEEALEVLRERKKQAPTDKCPFPLSERKIRTLRTKMKKFAKGFGIDLNTIHMLRHYFSTKCLMSGFTVQEVGQLLGHADEGQLVLKTYGHVCDTRLRGLVHKLKLTSDDDAESEPN